MEEIVANVLDWYGVERYLGVVAVIDLDPRHGAKGGAIVEAKSSRPAVEPVGIDKPPPRELPIREKPPRRGHPQPGRRMDDRLLVREARPAGQLPVAISRHQRRPHLPGL